MSVDWIKDTPIAHRGLHDAPNRIYENTLGAIKAAIAEGFAIECDVQLSSDGVAMVFHDADLKRMCGLDQKITDLTASQLSQIPVLDGQDTVQSLNHVLSVLNGAVPIIIELKGNPPFDEALAESVCQSMREYHGKAAVMSFSHQILGFLRKHNCTVPIGLTAEGNSMIMSLHQAAYEHEISFVSYSINDLPHPFVEEVRSKHNMPVITWTVRDEAAMQLTYEFADQITFEGFDPRKCDISIPSGSTVENS